MRQLYLLVLLLGSNILASAQIQIEPLTSNPVLRLQSLGPSGTAAAERKTQRPPAARQQALQLPFFDDFSYPGPYPNPDLWVDSNVYINDHLAFEPLSIGTATFDGLAPRGFPYGGGFGPADYLTSRAIDLDDATANDGIFINFYIQPKGITNFFPTRNDSLVLQFLDTASQWISIDTFMGLQNSTSPLDTFRFRDKLSYPINSPAYFHDAFQFRFVNHCNRLGLQYLWHLDYVYIDTRSPIRNPSDLALVSRLQAPLRLYNHIPWEQFRREDLRSQWRVQVFNHAAIDTTVGFQSNIITIRQEESPSIIFESDLLRNDALLFDTITYGTASVTRPLNALFDALIPIDGPFTLLSDYTTSANFGEDTGFPGVTTNNTASRTNSINDFYAYDDGSTEGVVASRSMGNQIAVQYDLREPDILRGVAINFPFSGSAQSGDFVIKVWEGSVTMDNLNLVYTSPKKEVINAQQFFDTLNAFTTYPLVDEEGELVELSLTADTFLVGIEHISVNNTFIGLGYDLNSRDAQPFQWFKPPSSQAPWFRIDQPGSLMIRPVFGDVPPVMTQTEEVLVSNEAQQLQLFPNPARDRLQLRGWDWSRGDWELRIFNTSGQLLLQQVADSEIEVAHLPNGIYILQLHHADLGQQIKEKFLILR